ncbi:thioredoxin family protein [Noviherbaspirillum galbum]|uniref:Thioredoxin family protein n=1 Tax=Noviherbaspirillum galbum TaxID=2709383 RepID=A0A6B3STW0_9BURK|nr:thioredoxin family protein [Noviherbaspirillum galbum]NEX63898.1 thioredoxin family protein [Noviherbaspirillum galbum]
MSMTTQYADVEPSREQVDAINGPVVLEFGAPWCSICMGTQDAIGAAMNDHPAVRHIKIEDGRGRPLGRSFRVKLWPTLVFMRDGAEVGRLVRPGSAGQIREALAQLQSPPGAV